MIKIVYECDVCHNYIEPKETWFKFKENCFLFGEKYIYPHCMCQKCWDDFQLFLDRKRDIRYSNPGDEL